MDSEYAAPPWDFEFERRQPLFHFPVEAVPVLIFDNTGAPIPSNAFLPTFRLATGAFGANKMMETAKIFAVQQGVQPNDILAGINDPDGHGFWRRILVYEFLVQPQSVLGPLTPEQRFGIGMGSYNAAPPDPAVSTNNVVRVWARADTKAWELYVHRGDGASAATITPLVNVPNAILNRSQRVRIVYVPNVSVTAIVDGIVGAQVTAGLPIIPPTAALPSEVTQFVTSGSAASSVRCSFTAGWLQVFGLR